MSDKKITDLQLRSNCNDDVNFGTDDGIQSYRVTAPQVATYALAKPRKTVAKTANYTLTALDHVIYCDCTGGGFQIDLPTAVGIGGKIYKLLRTDAVSTNDLTIDANSTEEIDGALTFNLMAKESVTIISDGADWQILDHKKVLGAVLLQRQEAANTPGGDPTEDAWTAQELNTLINPMSVPWINQPSDTQFRLTPGSYLINAEKVITNRDITNNSNRLRLWDVTNSAQVFISPSHYITGISGGDDNRSHKLDGPIFVEETTIFEFQYYLLDDSGNGAGYGDGLQVNIDSQVEVYAQVLITKIA